MKKAGTIIGSALLLVAAIFAAVRFLLVEKMIHYGETADVSEGYDAKKDLSSGASGITDEPDSTSTMATTQVIPDEPPPFAVTHIIAPNPVKAVYYTSWAAGTASFKRDMDRILATSTEINSVVVDVKDYSGRISYIVDDPALDDPLIDSMGSSQNRIPDIEHYIAVLHDRGIYVIGRIQSFEDPFATAKKPEWAVVDSRTGKPWKDAGGAYWLDPSNHEVWDYIIAIAKQAYGVGFDEINFDYVRFPSDGTVANAVYAKSASTTKTEVITEFFANLHDQLSGDGIPISADLFGQTTSEDNDMGIGQVIENAFSYFDYVDPMVYPSHFVNGFIGYANPAEHPYGVVKYSMDKGIAKAVAVSEDPKKLRPWLQAFDLGASYTPDMVDSEIKATYDSGLNGWMLWNAGSLYSRYSEALSDTSSLMSSSASTTLAILEAKKAADEAKSVSGMDQTAAIGNASSTLLKLNASTTAE